MHLIHQKYRPDIDGLRAIAILPVIIFHAFPDLIPGGFIGVDIFFVISGYLISKIIFSSLEKNRFSIVEFYIRRIRRILPALVLVLIATLCIGWGILLQSEYSSLGKHIAASTVFIQNINLWDEVGYFDGPAHSKPLLHLWSLAVEEQFYIAWPLLMALAWKYRWGFFRIAVFIALLSFLSNIYLVQSDSNSSFYLPHARFWELMAGAILAYLNIYRSNLFNKYENIRSVIGVIIIAVSLVVINDSDPFPGWFESSRARQI